MSKPEDMTKSGSKTIKYAVGQHDLICNMLGVSTDPSAPGSTAYEAVCVLQMKLAEARRVLKRQRTRLAKNTVAFLDRPADKFAVVQVTWNEKHESNQVMGS